MNIADIARVCNTSPATVSRVLNGKSDVRPETRERVLALLRQHEFRPRIGRQTHDGVGLYLSPGQSLSGYYYSAVLDSIATAVAARERVLTIVPARIGEHAAVNELDVLVRHQRLMGLLFLGDVDEQVLLAARKQGVRHVVVDHPHPSPGSVSVGTDIPDGIAQAVEHLIRLGHRRISLLSGPGLTGRDGLRVEGLRGAFARAGLPIDANTIIPIERPAQPERAAGSLVADAIERLWTETNAPTALIASGEWVAIPALATLARMGVRIPRDLSFVTFHDTPSSQYFHPPLTAIRQPISEMGERAVDLLIRATAGDESVSFEPHVLSLSLVIRESTGLAPTNR